MSRTEVRFAGIGGQGSVLASVILAEAAGVRGGRFAVQTQFYAPAIRGGAASGDVILDDGEITFPWVLHPNVLVAQHQDAIRAHGGALAPGAVVIADTVYVTDTAAAGAAQVYRAPLTDLADQAGTRRSANMVALGLLARLTDLVGLDDLRETVRERSPLRSAEVNLAALESGYALAPDALGANASRYAQGRGRAVRGREP